MLAVRFYDAVVALHVMAIVIAFGVTFVYPLMYRFIATNHPTALPAFHATQVVVGKRVIAPAGGIAFLLGVYLASDRDLWSETWVTVPALILVLLLGAGGAFFSPREQRLAVLAEDPQSAEYQALVGQVKTAGLIASLLVLLAIYFMVAKPFA